MNIGLTKKLIDQLKIETKVNKEEKDLFSWTTNLITINRRKTVVVVVNDSSGYGFVLYGLKAKEFANLEELIKSGIRTSLENFNVKKEIISKYIEDAEECIYTKTRGPRYVRRIVKACENVSFSDELIDSNNIYQYYITKRMNNYLIKIDKNNYKAPKDLMIKDLEAVYGEGIIECEAAELQISLDLGYYKAIRNIVTPINITFYELHKIIQKLYEWQDYHLNEFLIYDSKRKCILNLINENQEVDFNFKDFPIEYQSQVKITDYIKAKNKMIYHYDYGDSWEHEIKVKKIIPNHNINYPICTIASGDAPPEDVGGIYGFMDFYDIMKNPDHPEYNFYYKWARENGYRNLDIKFINMRLEWVL